MFIYENFHKADLQPFLSTVFHYKIDFALKSRKICPKYYTV